MPGWNSNGDGDEEYKGEGMWGVGVELEAIGVCFVHLSTKAPWEYSVLSS